MQLAINLNKSSSLGWAKNFLSTTGSRLLPFVGLHLTRKERNKFTLGGSLVLLAFMVFNIIRRDLYPFMNEVTFILMSKVLLFVWLYAMKDNFMNNKTKLLFSLPVLLLNVPMLWEYHPENLVSNGWLIAEIAYWVQLVNPFVLMFVLVNGFDLYETWIEYLPYEYEDDQEDEEVSESDSEDRTPDWYDFKDVKELVAKLIRETDLEEEDVDLFEFDSRDSFEDFVNSMIEAGD